MAFCRNCGVHLTDPLTLCPSCKHPNSEQQQDLKHSVKTPPVYQPPLVPRTPTLDDIQDTQDGRTMAILSYIPFLFLFVLMTGNHKTSSFVKYHTNQGILLSLSLIVLGMICTPAALTLSGLLELLLLILICLAALLSMIAAGIYNAATGKRRPLPVIGKISLLR
ncbi:MAG: hypothetical protein FWG14_05560 [Peptococcaceae bacterium]|nr:hypothetical protein [Peptococcaceae bacterium]